MPVVFDLTGETMAIYRIILAAIASAILSIGFNAHAQETYPNKPVIFIVPFPPGQTADIVARILGNDLSKTWGQSVVIENRAGGLGIPGMVAGRDAKPDGYTLTMAPIGPFALNRGVIKNLPYDPMKDFTFIGGVFRVPYIIVANPDAKIGNVTELVNAAKRDPGKLSWGAAGTGQLLSIEWFKQLTGLDIVSIPYKGSAQGLTDLMGGQLSLLMDSLSPALPHIQAGKIKAIAVTTLERSPQLPDTPTLAEQGYPTFSSFGWVGLVAPKGTPRNVVVKISADLQRALTNPELKKEIIARGAIPDPRGSEEWAAFVNAEIEKWRAVMTTANIQPN